MSDETNRRIQVDLSGQTAIVTGASRGSAGNCPTAGRAGQGGLRRRNAEKLQETVDAIQPPAAGRVHRATWRTASR